MVAKREKSIPRRGTLPKPSAGALKPSHGCHGDRVHPPLPTCLVQPSVAHFPPLALPTPTLPPSAPPPLPPTTHHQCPSPIPPSCLPPLPSSKIFFFIFPLLHVLGIRRQRSKPVSINVIALRYHLAVILITLFEDVYTQWIFFIILEFL